MLQLKNLAYNSLLTHKGRHLIEMKKSLFIHSLEMYLLNDRDTKIYIQGRLRIQGGHFVALHQIFQCEPFFRPSSAGTGRVRTKYVINFRPRASP